MTKKLLKTFLSKQSEFVSIAGQKDMEKLLKYAMDYYYDDTKTPIMNDAQYDMLLDSYQNRFPNTPFSKSCC